MAISDAALLDKNRHVFRDQFRAQVHWSDSAVTFLLLPLSLLCLSLTDRVSPHL